MKSGSLLSYVLGRLLLMIPMAWVLVTIVFFLMRVAPGDPIQAALGGQLTPDQLAERQAAAGYDRPVIVQYLEYLWQLLQGDLGRTVTDNRPVIEVVAQNGMATLGLTLGALLFAIIVAVPVGLIAGRRRDSGFDVSARLFSILTYAAPVFFIGLAAQLIFGKALGWLPTSGQASPLVQATVPAVTNLVVVDAALVGNWGAVNDALRHLILPSIVLGLGLAGVLVRLIRVNLAHSLGSDYVESARARGVGEYNLVAKHGFRNALVPVITVLGLQLALLLAGAVLTEKTFGWPGIGNALVQYLNNRDYVAVQGIITIFAVAVVLVSVLVDVVNALIDPRARYS